MRGQIGRCQHQWAQCQWGPLSSEEERQKQSKPYDTYGIGLVYVHEASVLVCSTTCLNHISYLVPGIEYIYHKLLGCVRVVCSFLSTHSSYRQAAIQQCQCWQALPSHYFTGGYTIIIRTHDGPENPYIPLLLHSILGPDYYVPP